MKNTTLLLTSLVLLAAFAAPAPAQSLGDAARREAERRARLTEPTKVITSADVTAVPSRGGATPSAPVLPDALVAPAAAAAAESAPAETHALGAEPRVEATVNALRDEQHWRERAQVIRGRLGRLQSDSVALEGRVAEINAAIDAASGSASAALAADLRQAAAMLTGVQLELRQIQNEWRQFEDRAVQAKIPTAWIR